MSYPLEQLEPSAGGWDAGRRRGAQHERILADAAVEAERIRELARAEGHAEGLAQGREDGLAEARSAALALAQALAEAQRLRAQLAEETERDAVALGLALAAKILAGALEVQPERVLDAVRGALRRATDRRRMTVLVNPADLQTVSAAIAKLGAQVGGVEHCDVQADRRVGAGGAIVRTLESEIDATVQTQLERAREVIQAELAGGEPFGEEPLSGEPIGEQPLSEEPTGEQPTGEQPTGEQPTREEPTGEQPTGEELPGER